MGTVVYGPALVTNMREVVGSAVFTWSPPRSIIGKRKLGRRKRKVGKHSIPDLLARLDRIWRAMPPSGKFALRRKAAVHRYTNYVWFRRHVLNHQARTGWSGPLALDLDTAYYHRVEHPTAAPGDIVELVWDDPASSPASMDITDVAGVNCTMVQAAIHCEDVPPPPQTEYVHIHGWTWEMPPYWSAHWNLTSGAGDLHYEVEFMVPPIFSFDVNMIAPQDWTTGAMTDPPPWAKWSWVFTPTVGEVLSDSGTDNLW